MLLSSGGARNGTAPFGKRVASPRRRLPAPAGINLGWNRHSAWHRRLRVWRDKGELSIIQAGHQCHSALPSNAFLTLLPFKHLQEE